MEKNNTHSLSRRQFLAVGAVGLAPLAVTRPTDAFSTSGTIRVGLIGFGARGRELARTVEANPGATLVAVSEIFEPRKDAARASGAVRIEHDWRSLLDRKDIDAVMIATPDHWHAPMAIAALESGKDVYCESPMALRADDAKAVRDCAARTGRILQLGMRDFAQGQWKLAHELIQSGAIGRVAWGQGSVNRRGQPPINDVSSGTLDWPAFHGDRPTPAFDRDRYISWRNYWDYSGGIATEVFHDKLAALMAAVGPEFPVQVSAAGGVYARDGREVPDSFVMSAEYPGGYALVLTSSMGTRNVPAIIRGEKASIEFHGGFIEVTPEHGEAGKRVPVVQSGKTLPEEWIEAIRTRRPCSCNEEIGYKTAVAISMAVEAYRREKTLFFDPIRRECGTAT